MARQRTIHPDFFDDAKVLRLKPLERIFFAGLWCHADKRGVLVDDPETLSIKILPRDAGFSAEAALVRMTELGLIHRYADPREPRRLLWIVNFTRYQRPHPREAESGLPLPDLAPKTSESGGGLPTADPGSPKVGNYSRILRPSDPQAFKPSLKPPPGPRPRKRAAGEKPVVVVSEMDPELVELGRELYRAIAANRAETLPGSQPETISEEEFIAWYVAARGTGAEHRPICRSYRFYREDEDFAPKGWPTRIWMHPRVWTARLAARDRRFGAEELH